MSWLFCYFILFVFNVSHHAIKSQHVKKWSLNSPQTPHFLPLPLPLLYSPGLYLASYESESPENQVEKDRWKALRCVWIPLRWEGVQVNVQRCSPPPPCVSTGLTFWERHEAQTAADPPASEGARVLIALIRTVKEPSWYLGVCFVFLFCTKLNDLREREKKKIDEQDSS